MDSTSNQKRISPDVVTLSSSLHDGRKAQIDLRDTRACEEVIGYTFHIPLLLWEALQADGSFPCTYLQGRYAVGNKRLTIVGDRVLDLLLARKWYYTMLERCTCDYKHL